MKAIAATPVNFIVDESWIEIRVETNGSVRIIITTELICSSDGAKKNSQEARRSRSSLYSHGRLGPRTVAGSPNLMETSDMETS